MNPSEKEFLEKYGIIFDTLKEDVSDMVISESDAQLIKELDFAKNFDIKYQNMTQLRKVTGSPTRSGDSGNKDGTKTAESNESEMSETKHRKTAKLAKNRAAQTMPARFAAAKDADSSAKNRVAEICTGQTADNFVPKTVKQGKIAEKLIEKYAEVGFRSFTKEEVLEYILCKVMDNDRIEPTVHNLIDKFGTLENVLNADESDLMIAGLSHDEATAITQHFELQRYLNTHKPTKVCLSNTEIAGEFCRERFGNDAVESFYVISLDAMRNVKACTLICRGIENKTEAYPISIVRTAMAHRANAILLCHNHPGGNLRPSNEDVATTQNIINLLNGIGIAVIDHIICTKDRYLSMFDQYQLNF